MLPGGRKSAHPRLVSAMKFISILTRNKELQRKRGKGGKRKQRSRSCTHENGLHIFSTTFSLWRATNPRKLEGESPELGKLWVKLWTLTVLCTCDGSSRHSQLDRPWHESDWPPSQRVFLLSQTMCKKIIFKAFCLLICLKKKPQNQRWCLLRIDRWNYLNFWPQFHNLCIWLSLAKGS